MEFVRRPMHFRSADEADQSTRESPSDATESASSESPVRTFLFVAVGTAAAAYVLSRLRSSGDGEGVDAPLETVRDRASATVPDAVEERVAAAVPTESQPIPIGGRGSDEREDSSPAGDSEGADTGDAAPIDESDVNADLADEPSPTTVSSGTSEEIQDKPAEPGEMAVDEDVEELVDEVDGEEADADGTETDETEPDESETDETEPDESETDETEPDESETDETETDESDADEE